MTLDMRFNGEEIGNVRRVRVVLVPELRELRLFLLVTLDVCEELIQLVREKVE